MAIGKPCGCACRRKTFTSASMLALKNDEANDTGLDAFETVIDAAWGQLLDETKLNKFLDNLNRISRMIMLESE